MSNQNEPLNLRKKKQGPPLLLAGFVITLSYLVTLIPLALYSVAQISAMLGKRVGLLLMVSVFAALLVVSMLIGSPTIYVTALTVLFSIPFFMLAIALREKKRSKIAAALVLWAPFIFIFGSFLYVPQLNNNQLDLEIAKVEKSLTDKQIELKSQIEKNVSQSSQSQLEDVYDSAISQVHALGDNKDLRNFVSYNIGQRMVWFSFGEGSLFLFFSLLICFANLIFLDLAFEQNDKLKAVASYVLKNVQGFSIDFVLALSQMPIKFKNQNNDNFQVVKHEIRRPENNYNNEPNANLIKNRFLKETKPENRVFLKGYSFITEGKLKSWGLKYFVLPLPIKLIALAIPFAMLLIFGGLEGLIAFTEKSHFQPLIGLTSFLSFAIISLMTLEGFLVFYSRVSNFVVVTLLLAFLLIGPNVNNGYLILVVLFGTISLLDNLYNWRQKGQRRL